MIVDGSKTFRYCGRGIPSDYTSTGNRISIAFRSDSSFELEGFNISFSTFSVNTPAPPGTSICPTREKKVKPDSPETMSGALYSPKSPNFYLNDIRCTVTLDVPDNYKTVIWFQQFSLQYSPTCEFDKLVLSDEIDSSTQCGGSANQLPPPMELKGKKVQLDFTSDDKITAAGFQLKYNITRLQQGRCVCTTGLGYVTIDNYKPRNSRNEDDIRFEFKSTQSSGMIMYAKGLHRDYVHVGYKDSNVFMYHIDLGTGELKAQTTNLKLNDNKWHKVHLTRVDRVLTITIDDGLASFTGQTPGGFNRLDIPTSKAYVLGAPSSQNLLPNFIGCIRDFEIDGHEPITNAWAKKPDYLLVGRSSMRLCSASDEQ
ncbi:cubilin-like [Oculina patagonica]